MPDKRNQTNDRTAASNLEVTPVTPRSAAADRKNKSTPENRAAQHRPIPELTVEPVVPRGKQTQSARPTGARPASPRPQAPERPARQSERAYKSTTRPAQSSPEGSVQHTRPSERTVRQNEPIHSSKRPLEDTRRLEAVSPRAGTQRSAAPGPARSRARQIEDASGNLYRPEDPKKAQKEQQQAQRQ